MEPSVTTSITSTNLTSSPAFTTSQDALVTITESLLPMSDYLTPDTSVKTASPQKKKRGK